MEISFLLEVAYIAMVVNAILITFCIGFMFGLIVMGFLITLEK